MGIVDLDEILANPKTGKWARVAWTSEPSCNFGETLSFSRDWQFHFGGCRDDSPCPKIGDKMEDRGPRVGWSVGREPLTMHPPEHQNEHRSATANLRSWQVCVKHKSQAKKRKGKETAGELPRNISKQRRGPRSEGCAIFLCLATEGNGDDTAVFTSTPPHGVPDPFLSRLPLGADSLGLLVLVIAAFPLQALDQLHVLLLRLFWGRALVDFFLPRVLLGLALLSSGATWHQRVEARQKRVEVGGWGESLAQGLSWGVDQGLGMRRGVESCIFWRTVQGELALMSNMPGVGAWLMSSPVAIL